MRSPPNDLLVGNVGAAMLNWALVEATLDHMTAMVFHRLDKIQKSKIPSMLKGEVEYLRRGFHIHKELSEFKAKGLHCLDRVTSLSQARHTLIHGALATWGDDFLTFERLTIQKNMHHVSRHTITLDDLINFKLSSLNLGGDLADVSHGIFTKIIGRTPEQTAGDGAV